MIKVAATPADVRKRKILDAVRSMNFANDPFAKTFGVSVDSQMVKFDGEYPTLVQLSHSAVWLITCRLWCPVQDVSFLPLH